MALAAGEASGKKVAIVGAGPAGLACARDLALAGHAVTLFEALPVPGGMLRVGIPAFRLPPQVVQREIDEILRLGIDLRCNQRVEDVTALLQEEGYDAVFVAVGAHQGARLPIPGADLPEVTVSTDFLRQVALQEWPERAFAGKRVLVLGGGSVAVDAATTARRLGAAWVGMACLESRETMPAHDWEIHDAEEEGIEVFPSRTFKEIVAKKGHVAGVRCAEIDFRGFVDGRPDFDEVPGGEHVVAADAVIFSIGQRVDTSCLPEEITVHGRSVAVDPLTLATSVPGLFAGGDAVTVRGFVVDAIAAGKRAARSIDATLRGEPLPGAEPGVTVASLGVEEAQAQVAGGAASAAPRHEPARLPAAERVRGFHEVYGPLTEEEARAEAARCLACGACSECLQCVTACQKDCIDHAMQEEIVELNVGAVILAPGLETCPGGIRPELGYGRLPNVVTSVEFERMLSASGPWGGVVQRPSDGAHPRRIAFIQCVGSRDAASGREYCSAICCMAATKEAVIAREHDPNVEATMFVIDVRSFGKGFERYVARAEREAGVRIVRSAVSTVTGVPGTDNLRVRHATPDGKNVEEEFDLVVLSVGLQPPPGARELAERLGIAVNEYGFAEAPPLQPAQAVGADGAAREGFFVAGPFAEPKDIPETVIEASCAAARASALLGAARGTLTRERTWPETRDVSDEPPRVGVFACHCGINIGAVVDVPAVVEYAAGLPGVAYAEHNLYTCSQDTQQRIGERIAEHGLNRVVVASCTPRTHEPLFQETLRAAGLNAHLFQMANVREQDSWVHREDHARATEKAKELVAMAVAKATRLQAIERPTFGVNHRALVIGGGLAGMTAALSIAAQGFEVTLVEREPELGGSLRHIRVAGYQPANLPAADPQALLKETVAAVSTHPLITLLTGAEVEEVGGYVGQYRTTARLADGQQEEIEHGAIVIATGARQIEPSGYGYGRHPGVVTQRELEERIGDVQIYKSANGQSGKTANGQSAKAGELRSVVMIQCVGSRDEEHPYCSRVCCSEAIKNALALKAHSPETEVTILYRDVRTFGFRERAYREARRQGVVFLQVDERLKPEVSTEGDRLRVDVVVQPEGEEIALHPDLVVLSAGIEANPANEHLARLVKVPLSEDGFFLEAHVKLRPLDFAADGVFLCGTAHSPRFLEETIAQAHGAALHAVCLLAKDELEAPAITAHVNPRLCSACGLCVEVCPYGARVLEPGAPHAEVVEVLCQGCGACVVACPNKASRQRGFEPIQVLGMLDAVEVG